MGIIMNNLELVITSIQNEIISSNVKESKTLMNTYLNLLDQIRNCHMYKKSTVELESHKGRFEILLDHAHKKIAILLNEKEYKKADDMVLITSRIESAIFNLKNMIC